MSKIDYSYTDGIFKTSLAKENWETKYRYDGETQLGTQIRIAKALASVETNPEQWEEKFLRTLVKFDENGKAIGLKATCGGRITANIGTTYKGATLLNCYINGPPSGVSIEYERKTPNGLISFPVKSKTSDSPDSLSNIMLALLEQAETLKSEGGYGINFSWIRPRGSKIKGVGIKHPGVVHYMTIWDRVADVIVTGDADGYKAVLKDYGVKDGECKELSVKMKKMARKGAMMGCLDISHPDIEEFIVAKQKSGMLTKFNLSVMITDEFMNAVKNDELFNLRHGGKVFKVVKARELYDLIMKSTYNRNEPGVIFYDNMQANNPLSYISEINATNPCGELPGSPYTSTVCLLGNINLTAYVRADRTFDFDLYVEDVRNFARMLDNVNDLSFVPLPAYEWAIKNLRQYGMGINGLGSCLYMMGIKYDSPEGLSFAERISALREESTWNTSALLAKEKGAFPAFSDGFLKTNWFINFTHISEETKNLIKTYGVRNSKTISLPPNGNTSIICDLVSNGIEPVFCHEYFRTRILDKWPEGLSKDNINTVLKKVKVGNSILWEGDYNGSFYVYEPHNRGLCIKEPVRDYGYNWVLNNYPNDITTNEKYLVVAGGIPIYDHVDMQAIVQKYNEQATSKTGNLNADYPYEDFKDLYFRAWEKGLIGFTTYRDGTMESVLSKVEKREIITKDLKLPNKFINGPMEVIKKEGIKFYMHFSYHPEDQNMKFPIAFWLHTNNMEGEIKQHNPAVKVLFQLLEDNKIDKDLLDLQREKMKEDSGYRRVSKMISMCLRHNIPIENIVNALHTLEDVFVVDTIYAVRKFLMGHVSDGTEVKGMSCPECKSESMEYSGGCVKCLDCGWSGCN